MTGEFSVCQFFINGDYEYVVRFVDVETALQNFKRFCTSVGAKLGTTTEVIITDGGDCTVAHWTFKDGLVWPKTETP
jgi:hypothetical protein